MPDAASGGSGITLPARTGLVLIGRNEGLRLRRALERLGRQPERCVYVDSGSTDGSVAEARSFGVHVVELDRSKPFTAARGRNAGFDYLSEHWPDVECVMFLDGDCLLAPGFLEAARDTLERNPRLGLVTGFLREISREKSVYNRLCDLEWHGPVGEIETCGGIAMLRASVYRAVGGMNAALIAGEEADLHIRMRRKGLSLERIPLEMALHDAELTEFRQWWKRNVRAGHACAEGALHYGKPPERFKVRESRSNWVWGLLAPVGAVTLAVVGLEEASIAFGIGYSLLYAKIFANELRQGRSLSDAEIFARYTVLGKVPQAIGQLRFQVDRIRGRTATLYEYKDTAKQGSARRA